MAGDNFQRELAGTTQSAALACAGVMLAMLAVYAGTGLHDGFGDWDLHRIGRRFRRALLWALPLAAVVGVVLHAYYSRLLRATASGAVIAWSLVRMFAHFPLHGSLALAGLLCGFAQSLWRHVAGRWGTGAPARGNSDAVLARWLGPPLWFFMLPFVALKLPMQGDIDFPQTISRRRLLRWLPGALAMLMLFTGAVSEDSGDRVDPYWLAAIASFWLGDYLIVAVQVAPALRERSLRKE